MDDDATTVMSSASSGREAEMRDQRLQQARDRLKQIHANLEDSMFFMVSPFTLLPLVFLRLIAISIHSEKRVQAKAESERPISTNTVLLECQLCQPTKSLFLPLD
jgi:hypothetical protein